MSRSAADATRFTATGPYASSKSGRNPQWPGSKAKSSPSTSSSAAGAGAGASSQPSRGPPGETPKQKVERLRAEARRARIEKSSSPTDRFLARGRVWADRAHKVTIYSLIAASGMAYQFNHFLSLVRGRVPSSDLNEYQSSGYPSTQLTIGNSNFIFLLYTQKLTPG